MTSLLASHHVAGICQTDLHLDNFLVADGLVYSLDGDGVLAQAGPLDERRSLQNLALYFSQLDPGQDPVSLELSAHYAQRRSWSPSMVRARTSPLIDAARLYRWRKLRSKIYRDCTAVAHLKAPGQACYVTRSYEPDLRSLLGGLDASCPADPARRLKNGNTATVWRALVGDRSLVVKRYNVKDPMHGVMRTLKESRASISWRNAHMLEMFGVATPAPVAFCIRRQGPLRPVGYFLAEQVDGTSLIDWIGQHRDQPEAIRRVAAMVGELFSRLRRLQISHGDMKAANFILSDHRLVLIDLDSMRQHRFRLVFERAWRRDMARFAANWQDLPRVMEIMREEIETAR
jgi:tRNA A-37 threonylcarbamoyl transferase component Bud32